MKKWIVKIGVIVFACIALVALLALMSGAFRDKVKPGTVEAEKRPAGDAPTDVVHKIVQTETVDVVGTLKAARRTEVSSRIMASIIEYKPDAGDKVEKDEVVVQLDNRDLKANAENARQAINAAEANLNNRKAQFERFKKMLESGAASQSQFDDAEAGYKAAQAQLKQAREALSAAETQLSYALIKAPVSGIVVDQLADEGDIATPGRPLLTIYDPSTLRLEAAVPEALASSIKRGDNLELRFDTLPEDVTLQGTVDEIVPQAEAASRSVLVKVSLPEQLPGMVEGTFGRVLIPARQRVRLCLATSAVRQVGQLRFVDVVSKDKTLERRQVRLGETSPFGRVEVLSGLEDGDTVVLHGPPPQPMPEGVQLFSESFNGEGGAQ